MTVMPSVLLGSLDPQSKVIVALKQGGDELHYLSIASMIAAGLLVIVYVQGRKKHVVITLLAVAALIAQLGDQVAAHYNKDSMKRSLISSARCSRRRTRWRCIRSIIRTCLSISRVK